MTITYTPIGAIHTPFSSPEGMPIQPAGAMGVPGRIEIFSKYVEGLKDLEGFSHVILLYHFHRSEGYRLLVTPFMDDELRGLFATRAPKRPNPIGLSVVRLVEVAGNELHVENVDVLDGTPLLDLKPYIPDVDVHPADRMGWLEETRREMKNKRSDDRFG